MKFKVALCLCFGIASLECAITMPSKAILEQRLHRDGFGYFLEKTKLANQLGGLKVKPFGVCTVVEEAFLDLRTELDPKTANTIRLLRRDDLIQTLLQDSPEALADLARRGLYTPSPVSFERYQRKSRCEGATRCFSRLAAYLRSFQPPVGAEKE